MIKDIDIHNLLPEKEIRDFFRDSLAEFAARNSQVYSKRHEYNQYNNNDFLGSRIRKIEFDIQTSQEELQIAKALQSVNILMASKGWIEHDVSDNVVKTSEQYLHFIGTEEEYQAFIIANPAEGKDY